MESHNRSPRINHVSWGRLEVEGEAEPYKDAKLFPGGSRQWNWRETGSRRNSRRPFAWNGRMPSCPVRDARVFEGEANRRARVADKGSRGALQQTRENRAGGGTFPHDVLMK
jgi:hypothetical protein